MGPASLVPWVPRGYLCVKTQFGCIKGATFVPSELIWQQRRKKKIGATKQCFHVQMWPVPKEPFWKHTSLISQLRVTLEPEVWPWRPSHSSSPPFRGMGCRQGTGHYTISAMSLCQHWCAPASCFSTLTAVFNLLTRFQSLMDSCLIGEMQRQCIYSSSLQFLSRCSNKKSLYSGKIRNIWSSACSLLLKYVG